MNKFFLFDDFLEKAEINYKNKKYDIALENINKAIAFDLPVSNLKKADAFELRGNIKIQMNQHLDAIGDFNKSIIINPRNPSLYFYRGMSLIVLNDKEGALHDFTKLIKFEPNNTVAIEILNSLKNFLEDK